MLDISFLQHVFDDTSFFDDIGRGGEEDAVKGDGFWHLDFEDGCWVGVMGMGTRPGRALLRDGAMAGVDGATCKVALRYAWAIAGSRFSGAGWNPALPSFFTGRLRAGAGFEGAGFGLFSWFFSGEFQGGDQLVGEAVA